LEQPVLAGYADLQDLLDGRSAGPVTKQGILLALARLAPKDDLAARTLLQAFVPGLIRLAVTAGSDDPMAREEIVAIAWERIRTYPPSRSGLVSLNVLRDTRKRYRAHRTIEAPTSTELVAGMESTSPSAEEEAMSTLLLGELIAAPARGLVTRRGLGLVLRTRVADTALEDIAAEEHVGVRGLAVDRWRTERRLRSLPLAG
jgi:hypothetical protein